jgi:hypothetical protein
MSYRVNLSVVIAEIYTADCTFNEAQQQVVGRETNLEKSPQIAVWLRYQKGFSNLQRARPATSGRRIRRHPGFALIRTMDSQLCRRRPAA